MPRNGSGTYVAPVNSWNPAQTGTVIEPTDWNAQLSDYSNALTQSIAKDGQTTYTANQPMGGNKLTGLGAGTVATDSARYDQTSAAVLTTRGDMLRRGASVQERFALGTSGQLLRSDGTDPVWATITGADVSYDASNNLTKTWPLVAHGAGFSFATTDSGKAHLASSVGQTWALLAAATATAKWNILFRTDINGLIFTSPATDIYGPNSSTPVNSITFNAGQSGAVICNNGGYFFYMTTPALSTTTLAGLVEKATQPETNAGTADKYPSAAEIKGMMFESAEIAITAASSSSTVAHGLGVKPKSIQAYLRCKTAEFGYAVDDEVMVNATSASGAAYNPQVRIIDATNLGYVIGSAGSLIWNASTGAGATLTVASWRLVIRAWAL